MDDAKLVMRWPAISNEELLGTAELYYQNATWVLRVRRADGQEFSETIGHADAMACVKEADDLGFEYTDKIERIGRMEIAVLRTFGEKNVVRREEDDKSYQFLPHHWHVLGYVQRGFGGEFLFHADETFLKISVDVEFGFGGATWETRTSRHLTSDQAAKWFALNLLPMPSCLKSFENAFLLTPDKFRSEQETTDSESPPAQKLQEENQQAQQDNADMFEEASLPEAALKAIVAGGLAGVLNEAGKVPAAQRHSRTMMEMLAKDARYYWWSAEDWVVHLKSSKPTILETDAWDHIKRWREKNKRERLGE